MKKDSQKYPDTRLWLFLASYLLVALILLTIGLFVQYALVNDGTKNFTGEQLVAAKHALTTIPQFNRENCEAFQCINIEAPEKIRVVAVTLHLCGVWQSPSNPAEYEVTVEPVYLFGITGPPETWPGCGNLYP